MRESKVDGISGIIRGLRVFAAGGLILLALIPVILGLDALVDLAVHPSSGIEDVLPLWSGIVALCTLRCRARHDGVVRYVRIDGRDDDVDDDRADQRHDARSASSDRDASHDAGRLRVQRELSTRRDRRALDVGLDVPDHRVVHRGDADRHHSCAPTGSGHARHNRNIVGRQPNRGRRHARPVGPRPLVSSVVRVIPDVGVHLRNDHVDTE